MKYTKKVPYFKKGDKIDKAARNLPKKQREAVLKVSSVQKEQERKDKLSSVGANFKKPTARVEGPKTSQVSKIKPGEKKPVKPVAKTRGEAFQQARARGDSEFLWQGKRYHTRTAEEEAKRKANEVKTSVGNAGSTGNAGIDVPGQSSASRRVSLGNRPKTRVGLIPKYIDDSPYELSTYFGFMPRIPSNYVFPTFPEITEPEPEVVPEAGEEAERKAGTDTHEQSFVPRKVSLGNGFKSNIGINPKYINNSPFFTTKSFFKSGGTINKFQRGNVLTNREQHLVDVSRLPKLSIPQVWGRKLFGTGPKPVETGRTFLNKAGEQAPELGNRFIMPGGRDVTTVTRPTNYGSGWLTSQRNIQGGDTTYITPGGNAPSVEDLPRYKSVFDNTDKVIWKSRGYQQGGAIQQQGVDKEALVADFVVRYLKTMGVPEEAIVTPEGSVNPEYEQELTTVITEIDSPEFWEAYQNSPDEVVTQVVRARNPNAVTVARKGAKLKRLSQLRIYKK